MSLPHFFLESQLVAREVDDEFPLDLAADDAKHARVLRLAPGEHIAVVDAARDYFECEIVAFDDGVLVVRIAQRFGSEQDRPSVVLAQGLAKGDKMDLVVRHATELGVSAFAPFSCDRSIVRLDGKKASARAERWRAIAKSAAMQSGQRSVPEVADIVAVEGVCSLFARSSAVLVCWEEAPGTAHIDEALERALAQFPADASNASVGVVVGPEGGLTEREVEALLSCNPRASLVSLGPSILRTETAGIVAPALTLHELGRRARREAR